MARAYDSTALMVRHEVLTPDETSLLRQTGVGVGRDTSSAVRQSRPLFHGWPPESRAACSFCAPFVPHARQGTGPAAMCRAITHELVRPSRAPRTGSDSLEPRADARAGAREHERIEPYHAEAPAVDVLPRQYGERLFLPQVNCAAAARARTPACQALRGPAEHAAPGRRSAGFAVTPASTPANHQARTPLRPKSPRRAWAARHSPHVLRAPGTPKPSPR